MRFSRPLTVVGQQGESMSGLESGVTLCSGNILRGALLQPLSQISVVEVPPDPNKVSRSVIESQRGSDVIEAHSSPFSHTDPAAAAARTFQTYQTTKTRIHHLNHNHVVVRCPRHVPA